MIWFKFKIVECELLCYLPDADVHEAGEDEPVTHYSQSTADPDTHCAQYRCVNSRTNHTTL